jgi:predicted 3-demethylubiquinone-9 3-methyltransferase (glyoxalase superfamily)
VADHAARADRRACRWGDEAKRAFEAMLTMQKIDVAAIEAARHGEPVAK